MHHETTGSAGTPPLLLLHGGGVAGWMWEPLRSHLDPARRVILPDLPGHGGSATADYVSHEETVAALVPLLEQETQPATVVGFSLGAQLAVLLAARRPDLVADAVVISAQAEPLRAVGPTLALLRLTAGLARNERFARLQARELFIPDALLPRYLETSAAISRTTLLRAVEENLRFTPPPAWRAHPGTALILVGAEEKPMMRRSAALLDRVHPRSTLEVAEGCGHGIPLQQPAELAARLEERLAT
ncbi:MULTISPECIES: alpha/beta hydrolase [unclassified Microbacterium]|uniref:alpha/beta fold hydrolase n=1 Tax=unclassified Microbacterium TaxID=2609290 RepID=UPI00246984C8|nr:MULTISPECIES: alpha/beta hydrolase [unclassified Microbacterium]MDH5133898.1 alpha/beta hydrolase [Microbacterium sp. RD10]MDH5137838.1 alpha/beta hydrolase [Microbacterium sp. RD11]MDH5144798.1 alpha/beta hydrolase [Microbacterium sp. RD12]MDH5155972.1 alpha/beta hydrolase [Microbacterium sp. RD06]MDH5165901.1 alpha/beta hydrolase [Microbacterium sp. RD02]